MNSIIGSEIWELQKDLLELLKTFHLICYENDIKYSLHGGTLLGAIREKGFIPWDDDVDVTFTREEFERFRSAVESANLGDDFKLVRKMRAYSFVKKRRNKPTIWIDVLTYDFISEYSISQKVKINVMKLLGGFLKDAEGMKLVKAHGIASGWKYYAYYFLHVIGRMFPQEEKNRLFDWFCINCFTGNKKMIHRSNDQSSAIGLILPAEVMHHYEMVPFEDTVLMVSSSYHDILVSSYGNDYMTPKEYGANERVLHSAVRDLLEE